MSKSVNKVILVGNVGSAPEMRTTQTGTVIAKLSLATNRTWKDASGNAQERTEWHHLTFFGNLAGVVEEWINTGDRLYVEGRIEYSEVEGDDGNKRYFTDVVVNEMVMLGSSNGATSEHTPATQDHAITTSDPVSESVDMPF